MQLATFSKCHGGLKATTHPERQIEFEMYLLVK